MKKLNSSWEKMVKHAMECCPADNHELIAYRNEAANAVLFFNCVYDLVGAEFVGDYISGTISMQLTRYTLKLAS
jgi:hypothetical protein